MTTNPLQQTIEALAKEKGIEPEVIITAIEDAVLTASRKYYKTNENLKTRFNPATGSSSKIPTSAAGTTANDPAVGIGRCPGFPVSRFSSKGFGGRPVLATERHRLSGGGNR